MKGGTKYRRRTAVGIKRRDERRCGGPALFFVEDWTASLLLLLLLLLRRRQRPSCPSTSSFLPSSRHSFLFTSSLSRASVQVCVQRRSARFSLSWRPLISVYLISYFLTYTLVPSPSSFIASTATTSPLVAPDDAATRHAARPRTMLDRIILGAGLLF